MKVGDTDGLQFCVVSPMCRPQKWWRFTNMKDQVACTLLGSMPIRQCKQRLEGFTQVTTDLMLR